VAFLCVFQQGEFKNTTKSEELFGESLCQKPSAKKLEKQNFFPVVFLPSVFNRAFGRFSA
jgi:hypothetical protein